MLIKYAVLSMFCSFAAVPVLAAGHPFVHASVPPASFLNYHVSTVRELSQEVTLDPAVRTRLANHFHISEAQITQYVSRNLVLTHLQKAGRYRVACVRRDGREYWVSSRLPKGTAIFASRVTGQPILKLACGNPMVPALPPGLQTTENNGNGGPAQFAYLAPPVPLGPMPMPGLIPEDFMPSVALIAGADVTPAVVQVSPSLETLVTPLLNTGGRSFNILPALLGAVAIGVASTGHGGSTPNAALPAPVPEASSSISLGAMLLLGAGGLFIFRRRRATDKPLQ